MSKGKLRNALILAAIAIAGILSGLGAGAMKVQAAADATTSSLGCSSCYTQYRSCLAAGTSKPVCVEQYNQCNIGCS